MSTVEGSILKYPTASANEFDYTRAYREHGNGVYLGEGEIFEDVVAKDRTILETTGVKQEQVGQSLRKLFSSWNRFLELRAPAPQYPCEGITLTRQVYDLGQEWSPYIPGLYSGIDWRVWIEGMKNGNKAYHPKDGPTFVSDMLPEMIEKLGFFEGDVFYGIRPEWAISVHQKVLASNIKPYVPVTTPFAWDAYRAYYGGLERVDRELSPHQIIKHQIDHVEVMDGLEAYVAPGELNLKSVPWSDGYYTDLKRIKGDPAKKNIFWGLLIAHKDIRLALDTSLEGYPFGAYLSHLKKGDLMTTRVYPYSDKLVG